VRFPLDSEQPMPQVDVALEQLAQAEAAAPQDEEAMDAPPPAPPLPTAKPARSAGALAAKAAIARATSGSSHVDGEKWKWWYFVGGGVFLLGFAVWKYITLSQAEATGDSGFSRVTGNDRTLYMIFGKWGVVAGTVLAGLAAIGFGIWQFKQQQKSA